MLLSAKMKINFFIVGIVVTPKKCDLTALTNYWNFSLELNEFFH